MPDPGRACAIRTTPVAIMRTTGTLQSVNNQRWSARYTQNPCRLWRVSRPCGLPVCTIGETLVRLPVEYERGMRMGWRTRTTACADLR